MAGKNARQKEIQAAEYCLFAAIRTGDAETVRAMLAANPAAVNAVAPKRPLDTRGMSPLQVALCTGYHAEIARYLLDAGADVNYRAEKSLNSDAYPVLLDAVNTAIWNARRYEWDGKDVTHLLWKHTAAEADAAFAFLADVLARGADVRMTDYYGRGVLMEAVEEAGRLCPVRNAETGGFYPGRTVTPEMTQDLHRIFKLLIDAGADRNNVSAYSGKSIREHYENEPVGRSAAICGTMQNSRRRTETRALTDIKIQAIRLGFFMTY